MDENMDKDVNMDLDNAFDEIENDWATAEPKTFQTLPDDDYLAKIEEINLGFSKKGRFQVVTTFIVMDGKFRGKKVLKFDGLTGQSIGFFKGYAEVVGIKLPKKASDLPKAIQSFMDSDNSNLINITVKTKDEMQNVYVKSVSSYKDEIPNDAAK